MFKEKVNAQTDRQTEASRHAQRTTDHDKSSLAYGLKTAQLKKKNCTIKVNVTYGCFLTPHIIMHMAVAVHVTCHVAGL